MLEHDRWRDLAPRRYFWRSLLLGLPLLVACVVVVVLLYRADRDATVERLMAEQRRFSSVLVRDVAYSIAQSVTDTSALADRAMRDGWLRGSGVHAAVEDELRAFVEIGRRYRRVRLFDAGGIEVARGETGGGGALVPSASDHLGRASVTATLGLPAGGVHVSRFERSPADAAGPLVRFGAPVRDDAGDVVGAVIVEFEGERLLSRLRTTSAEAPGFFWMLDGTGAWLLGPEASAVELEPGLGTARTFGAVAPEAWSRIESGGAADDFVSSGSHVAYERLTAERLARSTDGMASILPEVETAEPWIVIGYLPAATIDERVAGSRQRWSIVLATLVALLGAGALLAARHWEHQRDAAKAVASSEKRFRALLAAAPDAVVICDEDGRIVFFSEQAERLLGYASGEIVGEPVEVLVPESRRAGHRELQQRFWSATSEGTTRSQLDVSARAKGGQEIPVVIHLSPIRTHEGSFVFCDLRDLTEAQQAERAIVELNTHLERRTVELSVANDRLAARTTQLEAINRELEAFAYSAAHDLRTPLRGMDGFSRVLLEKYASVLDERGQDYLGRVRAAAQRMGSLLDDLLRLSRLSRASLQRASVDVSAMAREIAAETEAASETRDVVWTIEDGLVADADAQLLRAALENLLGNAWKYSARRLRAEIELGVRREGKEDVFFVRDNGAGFDPAYVDHLFRPFQRLHHESDFPGTGVGLALVQRIVHRHGGRVWAEAEVDRGATFFFTLGAAEGARAQGASASDPIQESA